MSDMNRWCGTGRVAKDIELKQTGQGKNYCHFTIAVNGFKKDDVSFIKCTAWEAKAETLSNYVFKGHKVGIEGRLQQNKWTDKDGVEKSEVQVVVDGITFLEKKKEGDSGQQSKQENKPSGVSKQAEEQFGDDLPF